MYSLCSSSGHSATSEGSSSTGQLPEFPSYSGTGPAGSNNYQSSNVYSGNVGKTVEDFGSSKHGPNIRSGILFPINRGEGIVSDDKGMSEVQRNPIQTQERPQTKLSLKPNKKNNIPARNQDNSNRPRGNNQNKGLSSGARGVSNSRSKGNGKSSQSQSTRGSSSNNSGVGRGDNSQGQGSSQRGNPNENLNSRPRGTSQNPRQRESNTNQKFAGGSRQSTSNGFPGNSRGTSNINNQGYNGGGRGNSQGQGSSQRENLNENSNSRPRTNQLQGGSSKGNTFEPSDIFPLEGYENKKGKLA